MAKKPSPSVGPRLSEAQIKVGMKALRTSAWIAVLAASNTGRRRSMRSKIFDCSIWGSNSLPQPQPGRSSVASPIGRAAPVQPEGKRRA
jgi:hypothetical protein